MSSGRGVRGGGGGHGGEGEGIWEGAERRWRIKLRWRGLMGKRKRRDVGGGGEETKGSKRRNIQSKFFSHARNFLNGLGERD